MHRALFWVSLSTLVSCSGQPDGSLRVVVNVGTGVRSHCAKVFAYGDRARESTPVLLAGRTSFVVGILQNGEPDDVDVQVVGYLNDDCSLLTQPSEASPRVGARFARPTPQLTLTLEASDGGVDLDQDNYPADVDCDDTNRNINPSIAEVCFNGRDDNCNLASDCTDDACDNKACRPGEGTRCRQHVCVENACSDGKDNDGDALTDCADPDCAMQPCGTNGKCENNYCRAPTEAALCFDGYDNDGDGDTDCADNDCPSGSMCSDTNACTTGDTCGGAGVGCMRGSAVVCNQPPSAQCFVAAGMCMPSDGTCQYEVMAGRTCEDGLQCTVNDTCTFNGDCVGTTQKCNSPPSVCYAPTGLCSEPTGQCRYAPLATGPCNDSDNCTINDTCDGAGGCKGVKQTCTPPTECWTWSSACRADNSCIFTARQGSCAGGYCNASSDCVTDPAYFVSPSNFSETQLPTSTGSTVANCDVQISTSTPDGGVNWATCSTGPAKPAHTIIPVGNSTAVLFFMDSLTIGAGATVRATGTRPLIFAVKGDVNISGTLDVSKGGAGSDIDCAPGAGNPGTVGDIGLFVEIGGGGGGGAFGTNGAAGSDGNGAGKGGAGTANGTVDLVPLRGGCPGGGGGRSSASSGAGGRGGGAVQVTAGGSITIGQSGAIAASGEGGRGGGPTMGGGGGGSGGAILLEGRSIELANANTAVVANGGAGGEGGDPFSFSGGDGQSGRRSFDPAVCMPTFSCGGEGGNGGSLLGLPEDGETPSCFNDFGPGGGGGGSVGRIRFNATTCTKNNNSILSPASTGLGAGCQ